jgi:zinc transport system permease protein
VLDTPAGPSIVCVAAITFLATSVLKGLRRQR